MTHYLTDMADVLRAAGVKVIEYAGWETRGRSGNSGYRDAAPFCVMWHHSATTGFNPLGDANYIDHGGDTAPIANIYLARDGTAWVMAAGPTNTNGAGQSLAFSKGTVPQDEMNYYSIGMEIANDGVGQWYPAFQIDAAFKISLSLAAAYGMEPTDVSTHSEYAPTRKIDPATDHVGGSWVPLVRGTARSWRADSLRQECARRYVAQNAGNGVLPNGQVDQLATAIIRVTGRNAQFISTGTLMPDGSVHCVCITWFGPGPLENPFLIDHSSASDIVHQTYTAETVQRDLVLVGVYPDEIEDSLHAWVAEDFAHAITR